ncbi:MAG: type II toxin-antitoxin system VapC family toxin [Candidatus Dormibacteraeota bacterium]|nr:type II toxin-antitoxin system VapC family toxin [Candidatus Dormibacteraeota bacterium]
MRTAVDSNILIDILSPDPANGSESWAALQSSLKRGPVVACDVVYGEVAGLFPTVGEARRVLARLGVEYEPTSERAALQASRIFRAYQRNGGERIRLAPDFLVGAHAMDRADRLLTRDRGFYRAYFRDLLVVEPSMPESSITAPALVASRARLTPQRGR